MTPADFPQSNTVFGPPPDLAESQCQPIRAYKGKVIGGSCDGSPIVVVAWQPDEYDRAEIAAGKPIFLAMLGGLAPHLLNVSFERAVRTD